MYSRQYGRFVGQEKSPKHAVFATRSIKIVYM